MWPQPVSYIAKFNRSGGLVYATYLSGPYGTYYGVAAGKLIAVDANQNVYVTGGRLWWIPRKLQRTFQGTAPSKEIFFAPS